MSAPASMLEWLRNVTPVEIKVYYWAALSIYTSPWFYLFIAAILLLERFRPAMREQRIFSPALREDFLWFNLDTAFKVAALPAFIALLHLAYDRITGDYVLPVLSAWPVGARVAVSFVVFDFLQWYHHWVRHRVTAL